MELGKAYIQVIPSTRGIKGQLTNELTGATSAASTKSGKGFMMGFGKAALKTMGAIGIATSVGEVMSKGWKRMTAIDDAKAKLQALGHSVAEVKTISENANAAVKGTAYGMDAAMTAAASATAAGIKPGKELTRYLQLMGDAAAVAGVDMNEMGSIFNKVAANGKVSTEEMNQLADRGIPIWQLLAKETGMSMEELRSAVSSGKIDIQDFQNAIESGMGGAAKKIGSTTINGAISNIGASISRMGANLLGSSDDADSFAGRLLPLMNNLMGFMGKIEAGASVLGQVIGSILGPIMDGIGQVFTELGKGSGTLGPIKDILIQVGQVVGGVIAGVMPMLTPILRIVFTILGSITQTLGSIFAKIKPFIPVLQSVMGVVLTVANGIMKSVSALVRFATGKLSFAGLVGKVKTIWRNVKNAITEPITKAKEKIGNIISKIKGKFPFNIGKIIKLKKPSITLELGSKSVLGKTIKYPKGFKIKWNAAGGIVDGATLIGAGEKGPEAIVPLDPFWKRLEASGGIDYNMLATVLINVLTNLDRTNVMVVDGKVVARSTAPYMRKEINSIDARANRALGIVGV
jgi:tape measure domain-containing protein